MRWPWRRDKRPHTTMWTLDSVAAFRAALLDELHNPSYRETKVPIWEAETEQETRMTNKSDKLKYSLVVDGEQEYITVFVPGREPLTRDNTQPRYEEIKQRALAGDKEVADLFDQAEVAARRFIKLSERVSVRDGRIYFDNVLVNNALTTQIVTFINEGRANWRPLVKFFEKVAGNPSENSREQLYEFLTRAGIRINDDGDLVAYKGLLVDNGAFVSSNRGHAIVDGEEQGADGNHVRIRQSVGSVVEMPRCDVADDPSAACAVGLHVATWDFAKRFVQNQGHKGMVVQVSVNPRDVVSVPHDGRHGAKVRVCRYVITRINNYGPDR